MTAPDLATYRAIHLALRGGADLLAEVAATTHPGNRGRVGALQRYWAGYAAEVHTHHGIEDDLFFPALVARVPLAARLVERTDEDHQVLDELGARCQRAVTALVDGVRTDDLAVCFAELASHMRAHLDLEDEDILPLFERHFSLEDYGVLEAEANKHLKISEALFTVPFVAHFLAEEDRAEILSAAPLPFRVLYRLTRRSHDRLVATLGGTPAAPTAGIPA